MADYELIGLNEAAPDLRAPTAADTGVVSNLTVTGVLTSSSGKVVGAGTSPETTPLNQYLGGMAFQSPESVVIKPQAVAVPNGVGDMVFQATSDSVIELEYKGSDAVVRTAQIPMSNERLAMLSRVTPLRQAVRVAMTAAASGSTGIQVLDNANLDMGTGNFTLHWEGALPDWTPAASIILARKNTDGATAGWLWGVLTAGTMFITLRDGLGGAGTTYTSTVAIGATDGSNQKLSVVITRETAAAAGSIAYYVNGVQLGSSIAITAGTPFTLDNALTMYVNGSVSTRTACDLNQAIIYNRALSAAEVLSLSVNGPALADIGASQVPLKTFDFSAGADGLVGSGGTLVGNIDGIGGVDNTCRLTATTTNSTRFVLQNFSAAAFRTKTKIRVFRPASNAGATGLLVGCLTGNSTNAVLGTAVQIPADTWTALDIDHLGTGIQDTWVLYFTNAAGSSSGFSSGDIFYIESAGTITKLGITGQWSAEDAQSNTGQIFDSSGNKNHALLPAAGATIIGRPTAQPQQVRWTNTWAGTNELQYIGGVNQAILPAKAYIESIVGVVTGATVEDIIIGDGSDTDRYVTITTGLAAGTTTFTLANRTTDGTNLKLTVDPDTNATMSIAWTITYRTLE